MVRVIEHRRDAEHDRLVELHVYPKPGDNAVPVAFVRCPVQHRLGYRWRTGELDTPIDEAFRAAIRSATEHAIPFVWVNDPHGLFPPDRRPPPP